MANAPATLVKFRPAGPWRFGLESGAREETGVIGHSDTFYSAIAHAMLALGELDAWLEATARAATPAVRFSSLFPFQSRTFFAPPPRNYWPPASHRLRFKSARFAPLALIQDLVNEQPLREDRWEVDPVSGCVIAAGAQAPFRMVLRRHAAVDRATGAAEPHATAALEFAPNAGLWTVIAYASEAERDRWQSRLEAAIRLLGDTGIGGERSSGWGRSEHVEFTRGAWPDLILTSAPAESATGYWLLSLYNPSPADELTLDRGDYALETRSGRVESPASAASWGAAKRSVRMIEEGSVVLAPAAPQGRAVDVAPAGMPHPVYRWGVALSIAVPWKDVADRPLAPLVEAAAPAPPPVVVEPEPEPEPVVTEPEPVIVEPEPEPAVVEPEPEPIPEPEPAPAEPENTETPEEPTR